MDLPTTVMPFILRGITLAGIDSVMRPIEDRIEAWQRLADILDTHVFEDICKDIGLDQAINTAEELMSGKVRGRVVVDLNK